MVYYDFPFEERLKVRKFAKRHGLSCANYREGFVRVWFSDIQLANRARVKYHALRGGHTA